MANKNIETIFCDEDTCPLIDLSAVRDALTVLNGTWKLPILIALTHGNKRFSQIAKDVEGISDKMLSKELKDLELNKLVTRHIHHSFPPSVTYSTTPHAATLKKVIMALRDWGNLHRKEIIRK